MQIDKRVEAQMAQITMKLLERADIKGGEVPTFVQIHNWLQAKVDGAAPEASDVPKSK